MCLFVYVYIYNIIYGLYMQILILCQINKSSHLNTITTLKTRLYKLIRIIIATLSFQHRLTMTYEDLNCERGMLLVFVMLSLVIVWKYTH
jgi:hypothetical protein